MSTRVKNRVAVLAASLMLAAALIGTACTPQPGPGERYRVPADFGEGILAAAQNLHGPPAGANLPDCRPTAEHPRPVILLHGILGNMADNMNGLSPFLANQGYCVYALTYGATPGSIFGGTADIRRSSLKQFGPFVDEVLRRTGARQVDVVGHSEGSVMPRWWMKFGDSVHSDGTPKVATYVGVAPVADGVELGGYARQMRQIPLFAGVIDAFVQSGCGACEQLVAGSTFFDQLNSAIPLPGQRFSGPTQPGVRYMMLATEWDNLIIPFESGFIPSPVVKNTTVQEICPIDRADHLSIVFDPVAFDAVYNFLAPDHPRQQRCVRTPPVFAPVDQRH